MRVNSILPRFQTGSVRRDALVSNPNMQNLNITQLPNVTYNDFQIRPMQGISYITFTGSGKNINQILSLAYENNGTGLGEDAQGGMGVVTYQAPESLREHEGLDVRSISPFHNYNNPNGGHKFLLTRDIPLVNGKLPEEIEARWFMSAEPGVTLEEFAKRFNYNKKDLRYVIQSEPNGKEATSLSKYCLIEPTEAKGEFQRMSDTNIGELKTVKYQLFKIAKDNPSYNKLQDTPNYWMYTEELAKTPKPYTYGPNGYGGMAAEIINSDFCRAVVKAGEQMNTKEFGHFNPASIWGHDRPVAFMLTHIADDSAAGNEFYRGTIVHHTLHNPGRNYQGFTDNPFEFARAVFSPEDVIKLKENPHYALLQNFNERGWGNLTEVEKTFVRDCLDPQIGLFKDYFGSYNITKIPIVAKMVNRDNSSIGTVSPNFDKEMKNPDMDVAKGLSADLSAIKTVSPLNGCTPANLGLDNNGGDFGKGANYLTAERSGFTPLIYKGNNIDEIIKNREKNAKWLMNIMKKAEAKGELARVFFNKLQIEQGRGVFGMITDFKPGRDMLLLSWGRPDEQKGFPIILEGYLKFLQRKDVPDKMKKRLKFQLGWGDAPFDKNSREWRLIENAYNKIITLDNGAYKGNIMLVDGRYPNRLVGCATHAAFTSRREMCGITPLESKTGAVPYLVTATGGPVDYTHELNGWKTKTAPEMNPPFDGLNWSDSADVIDDKRVARSSSEISDSLKLMVEEYVNDKESYVARCKKNIEEKFDWHNNDEFNGGKSANKSYRNDIWKIDQGFEARNKAPHNRLLGANLDDFKNSVEEVVENTVENVKGQLKKSKTKWGKILAWSGLGVAFVGAVIWTRSLNKSDRVKHLKAQEHLKNVS